MKHYFWLRKSAAPAKKINKYSIFYRNEGKNYNNNSQYVIENKGYFW